jgi:hypothetical protein
MAVDRVERPSVPDAAHDDLVERLDAQLRERVRRAGVDPQREALAGARLPARAKAEIRATSSPTIGPSSAIGTTAPVRLRSSWSRTTSSAIRRTTGHRPLPRRPRLRGHVRQCGRDRRRMPVCGPLRRLRAAARGTLWRQPALPDRRRREDHRGHGSVGLRDQRLQRRDVAALQQLDPRGARARRRVDVRRRRHNHAAVRRGVPPAVGEARGRVVASQR